MNAVAIEGQPSTRKYVVSAVVGSRPVLVAAFATQGGAEVFHYVPIPPSAKTNPRFKNPALVAAVDSMRVGDCINLPDRKETAQATMRIKKVYGKGSAVQRQHTDGTYTVWRVK